MNEWNIFVARLLAHVGLRSLRGDSPSPHRRLLAIVGPWSASRAADTRGTDELETTATKVLKAVEAKDDAPVGHVARGVDPDPWLVADVLVMGGHRTAALALAEAMPAPYGDGLRRWLEDGRPAAPAVFTAFKEVRTAMCAKAWAKAEARARAAEPALGDDPTSLALRYERARALGGLARHAEAARVAADVAAVAEGFGWWRQAALGRHFEALETLFDSPVRSAQCWRDLERVALASRDDGLRATALEGLATARERSRDVLGAVDAIDAAVELRAKVGDAGPWARGDAKRGALLLASGRKAEARAALEDAVRRAARGGRRHADHGTGGSGPSTSSRATRARRPAACAADEAADSMRPSRRACS
jgi:hypothetical protein